MAGAAGKIGWKIIALGVSIPTSIAARKAIEKGWIKAKHNEPPKNPATPGTEWSEALMWAAVSGFAVAVARLVAARGAAATWKSLTGKLPPGVDDGTST